VDGIAEREKTMRLGIFLETNGQWSQVRKRYEFGTLHIFLLTRNQRF